MRRYRAGAAVRARSPARLGVLLVNLGTPDAPTAAAVRRYLAEFLSDPRVVEIPRVVWKPILHGVILRVRPASRRSATRRSGPRTARRCWCTACGRGRCCMATSGSA